MEPHDVLPVREGYAAWAACYDDDGNPLLAIEEPVLRGWFGAIAGRTVLDLGCGTGRHTLALAQAGAHVIAIDFCMEMMERARKRLEGAGRGDSVSWVRHALPNPLPLWDESCALVVLGLVAEHLEDLGAVLKEVRRVLVPGGRVVLSALHPERTATGQTARFIDPQTGERRPIVTIHRDVADYLRLGSAAGLDLSEERTLVVPEGLALTLPRAVRYVGLPLGWAACWVKPVKP